MVINQSFFLCEADSLWPLQAVSDVILYVKKTMSAHLAWQLLGPHDNGFIRTLFSDSKSHVICEIEARISARATQTHQDFDTSLFVKNITDAAVEIFLCNWHGEDMNGLGGTIFLRYWGQIDLVLEKITHRRSPHSWHTPWLSKACSSSPSPERGRGRRSGGRGRGRKEVGEW